MSVSQLVNELNELAEWAEANEWEIPINLGSVLREAGLYIEGKENAKIIYDYPFVEKNPMFAIGYCDCCGHEILDGRWAYCPNCGAHFTETVRADCDNCRFFGGCCCDHLTENDECAGWEIYVRDPAQAIKYDVLMKKAIKFAKENPEFLPSLQENNN